MRVLLPLSRRGAACCSLSRCLLVAALKVALGDGASFEALIGLQAYQEIYVGTRKWGTVVEEEGRYSGEEGTTKAQAEGQLGAGK